MAQANYVCPHCGSDQVQRYSVAFAGGISDVNTNSVGVGLTGNGLGVGGAKTRGTAQTALSMSVAPPAKKGYGKEILKAFGIVIVANLVLMSIFGNNAFSGILSWAAAIAYLYFHTYKVYYDYNKNIWPKEMEEWQHSWLCMKCGNRFII